MFLIKRKEVEPETGFNQDVLAMRIARRIIMLQTSLAHYLNSKTARLSQNQKIIILIVICGFFGSICLYIILYSIN